MKIVLIILGCLAAMFVFDRYFGEAAGPLYFAMQVGIISASILVWWFPGWHA